jgi:hypothetical protein
MTNPRMAVITVVALLIGGAVYYAIGVPQASTPAAQNVPPPTENYESSASPSPPSAPTETAEVSEESGDPPAVSPPAYPDGKQVALVTRYTASQRYITPRVVGYSLDVTGGWKGGNGFAVGGTLPYADASYSYPFRAASTYRALNFDTMQQENVRGEEIMQKKWVTEDLNGDKQTEHLLLVEQPAGDIIPTSAQIANVETVPADMLNAVTNFIGSKGLSQFEKPQNAITFAQRARASGTGSPLFVALFATREPAEGDTDSWNAVEGDYAVMALQYVDASGQSKTSILFDFIVASERAESSFWQGYMGGVISPSG